MLDLLNAENQLSQARSQCVAARQEAFAALASLAHTAGVLAGGDDTRHAGEILRILRTDDQP